MRRILLLILIKVVYACIPLDVDPNSCSFCWYTQYSAAAVIDSEVTPLSVACQQKDLQKYWESEVYVDTQSCNAGRDCSGTINDPYDSIISALTQEIVKAQSYVVASIIINLNQGVHYILNSDFDDNPNIQFFRRQLWSITIKPSGYDITKDQSLNDQRPIVFLKTDKLYFYISHQLSIYNIIFDASDIQQYFLSSTHDQSNNKKQFCVGDSRINCQLNGAQFSSYYSLNRLPSLFNLEVMIDLIQDQKNSMVDANINNPDLFPVFPPIPTLKLTYVDFQSFYTGLILNSDQMTGMRGLILPAFGTSSVQINHVLIDDCFFPDGIIAEPYQDLKYTTYANYLDLLHDESILREAIITDLTVSNYNSWGVGTYQKRLMGGVVYYQPYFMNSLFNFGKANFTVNCNKIHVQNNQITPYIGDQRLYGRVILVFRVYGSGVLTIKDAYFDSNLNFALLNIKNNAQAYLSGEISDSSIENYNFQRCQDEQCYLFSNTLSNGLNFSNFLFHKLIGNVFIVNSFKTYFDQCTFTGIKLPFQGTVIMLVQAKQLNNVYIQNSTIQYIQGNESLTSTFAFFARPLLSLSFINVTIELSDNMLLVDNSGLNYNLYFLNVIFRHLHQYAIVLSERYSNFKMTNIELYNITSDISFITARKSNGPPPSLYVYNLNMDMINVPSVFDLQSVTSYFEGQNITITNSIITEAMLLKCCFFTALINNITIINSEILAAFQVTQGYFTLKGINYISPQEYKVLPSDKMIYFGVGNINVQLLVYNSYLELIQGVGFVSCVICLNFEIQNTTMITQNIGTVIVAQSTDSLLLQNITIKNTDTGINTIQKQDEVFLILCEYVTTTTILQLTAINTQGVGIIAERKGTSFQLQNFLVQDASCGSQSCFIVESLSQIVQISLSKISNVKITSSYLMEFSYCLKAQLNNLTIEDVQVIANGTAILTFFQTNTDLQYIQLFHLSDNAKDVTQQISALVFEDAESLLMNHIIIDNSQNNNSSRRYRAGLSSAFVNYVTIQNLFIDTSSELSDGVIQMSDFLALNFTKVNLQNIDAQNSVLLVSSTLKGLLVFIDQLTCQQNKAKISACLELQTESDFLITSMFVQNIAGAILVVESIESPIITVINSHISKINQMSSTLFLLTGCQAVLSQLKFQNITISPSLFKFTTTNIIMKYLQILDTIPIQNDLTIIDLIDSDLLIDTCQFVNDINVQTGLISAITTSISIIQTLVQGLSNTMFTLDQSSLILYKTLFNKNQDTKYFSLTSSDLNINECQFLFNKSLPFFQCTSQTGNNQIYLNNLIIQYGEGADFGFITGYQQVIIQNTIIKSQKIQRNFISSSQGVQLINCQNITIVQSQFSGLYNDAGGCLSISSTNTNAQITNTIFKNCMAKNIGGALYVSGNVVGSIKDSIFESNVADMGGALAYDSEKSTFSLINCTFTYNKARQYAASVMQINAKAIVEQIKFISNQAISQVDMGSYATQLSNLGQANMTMFQQIIQDPVKSVQYFREMYFSIDQNSEILIASGQPFPLILALIDDDGLLVRTDNQSKIQIQPLQGDINTVVDGGYAQSVQGFLAFKDLVIVSPPGYFFKLQFQATEDGGQLLQTKSFELSFHSRKCIPGEILSVDQKCQICGDNTYSLADPHDPRLSGTHSCSLCPNTAQCIQEAIYPKYGFWVMNQQSKMVLKCKVEQYCLGKEQLYQQRYHAVNLELQDNIEQTKNMYDEQCLEGHEGVLCQECKKGYFKFTPYSTCIPCQGNKALTYLIIILAIGLLMLYSIYQSQNYMNKSRQGLDRAVLIKVFLNYIQTLSLLGGLSLDWSPRISFLLNIGSDVFGTSFHFVSPQCLLADNIESQENQYYASLILQVAIPFIVFILNCLYFFVIVLMQWGKSKKQQAQNMERVKRNKEEFKAISNYIIVLNGVVCLHLFYPIFVTTPSSMFYCTAVSEDTFGQNLFYLQKNMHIQCWTPNFNKWFIGFGITVSTLFGLGVPAMLGIYMYIYRNDFKTSYSNGLNESNIASSSLNDEKKKILKQTKTTVVKKSTQLTKKIIIPLQSQFAAQIQPDQDSQSSKQNRIKMSRAELVERARKRESSERPLTQKLRMSIRNKQFKRSEVLTFLVDPYKENVFFWEGIVLVRKFMLILVSWITNLLGDSFVSKGQKYLILNIYLIVFFRVNLYYRPFYSPLMNLIENYSFLTIICTCLSGIMTSVFSTQQALIISDLIFFTVNGAYIIFVIITFCAFHAQKKDMIGQTSKINRLFSIIMKKHSQKSEMLNFQASQIGTDDEGVK